MTVDAQRTARPASIDDLKLLLGALHDNGVDYLLIGGYARMHRLANPARWISITSCNRPSRKGKRCDMR